MNRYPLWKNLLVAFVLLIGFLYALPNIFSQDPVVEISGTRGAAVTEGLENDIKQALGKADIKPKRLELESDRLRVRLNSPGDQLRAQDVIARMLPPKYTHALTLSPDLPRWLVDIGGRPMNLGLDLRGGIHVLIDVDMDAALKKSMELQVSSMRTFLREQKLRYVTVKADGMSVEVRFRDAATRDKAMHMPCRSRMKVLSLPPRGPISGLIFQWPAPMVM